MRKIKLTRGKYALIDNKDYERISKFKWCAHKGHHKTWYACRTTSTKDGKHKMMMHRFIMNAPAKLEVDHRNSNGLDNRRSNLRLATSAQNKQSSRKRRFMSGKPCKSKYKGVTVWVSSRPYADGFPARYWMAQIKVNGKHMALRYSKDELECALAYDAAARKYFGEFARTNF